MADTIMNIESWFGQAFSVIPELLLLVGKSEGYPKIEIQIISLNNIPKLSETEKKSPFFAYYNLKQIFYENRKHHVTSCR